MSDTIQGKGGISATVVADSVHNNNRLTTLELTYPRFIHSEFMTHRRFSRNAASSRAIPVKKIMEQVKTNPAMPIHWGENKPGMSASIELSKEKGQQLWKSAAQLAVGNAESFRKAGYHKQIVNRILEPYMFMKTVVSSTEWQNFFDQRLHKDAQPEIYELARVMRDAINNNFPIPVKPNCWHTPYSDGDKIKSVASCARVSYSNHGKDYEREKDVQLYKHLLKEQHMSPFEHVATPFEDMDEKEWTGNFTGWVQLRKLIERI